jgi:hypothetical protein
MTHPLVSEYARQGIFDYPGPRYESNFITDNETLFEIPDTTPEAIESIDAYLEEKGLPKLAERIPVIAYGANVSPGTMTSKFGKYPTEGTYASYEEMHTVPVLHGTIEESDVVWHGRPSQAGSYFAELYQGEATKDAHVKVAISFLTPEQVAVMHTTEGDTYGVSSMEVTLADGYTFEGIFYGARDASILLDEKGSPISVAGVTREGTDYSVMTPREALDYTISSDAVQEALNGRTVEEYIAEGPQLTLKEKKARQVVVQNALQKEKKTLPLRHGALDENDYGRANFISLPRGVEALKAHSDLLELMETSIARIRPNREERELREAAYRQKRPDATEREVRAAADPAERLRQLASNALTDPARARALARAVPAVSATRDDIMKQQERTINE